MSPRWQSTAPAVMAVLAAVLLLPFAAHALYYGAAVALGYPHQLDREEGFLLQQALLLAAGRTPYPALDGPPWTVGNYPPVYPLLGALFAWLGPTLAPLRLITVLGAVLTAVAGALAVRRAGGWAVAAVVAPVPFLASYEVNYWIAFARVDLPALGFSAVALLLATVRARRAVIAAALAAVAAVYTRQTAVVVPVAVLAGLWWAGHRREAALFAGVGIAAGVAAGALLMVLTGGRAWFHLVTANRNAMDWGQLVIWLRFLRDFSLLLLLAGLAAWGLALRWSLRRAGGGVLLPALVVAWPLSLLSVVTIAKVGADANYLLELQWLTALLVAAVVGLAPTMAGPRGRWMAMVVGALLLAHAVSWWVRPLPRLAVRRPVPPPAAVAVGDELLLRVATAGGPVLADDPILLLRAGMESDYQPFIMATLAREGRWDESPMVERLASGYYALLLLGEDIESPLHIGYTPAMRAAIRSAYRHEGDAVVMFPRRPLYIYTRR